MRSGVGSGGHGVGFHGLRGSQRFGGPGAKVAGQLGNLQGCPQLACGLQAIDQRVNVLGQVVDGLGGVLRAQQACICAAYVQHPLCAQVFQRTAHGGRQLAKLIGHHVSLALQGFDDHFCGQCPFTRQLAQLTRGHTQTICHGLGQAWGLLHDTVELFATQHARLQALDELGDGCIRRLRAGTRQLHSLVDGLRERHGLLGSSLGALACGLACIGQPRKQRGGAAEAAVSGLRHAGDLLPRLGKQLPLTRGQLYAGAQVLEFVRDICNLFGFANGPAAAQGHHGNGLDALDLRGNITQPVFECALRGQLLDSCTRGRRSRLLVGWCHALHFFTLLSDGVFQVALMNVQIRGGHAQALHLGRGVFERCALLLQCGRHIAHIADRAFVLLLQRSLSPGGLLRFTTRLLQCLLALFQLGPGSGNGGFQAFFCALVVFGLFACGVCLFAQGAQGIALAVQAALGIGHGGLRLLLCLCKGLGCSGFGLELSAQALGIVLCLAKFNAQIAGLRAQLFERLQRPLLGPQGIERLCCLFGMLGQLIIQHAAEGTQVIGQLINVTLAFDYCLNGNLDGLGCGHGCKKVNGLRCSCSAALQTAPARGREGLTG